MTRHLQGYLSAGMHLLPALEGIALEYPKESFRVVVSEMAAKVAAGTSFGDVLSEYPKVFDDTYIAMVRAAEATNSLADVLDDLAVHLEREHDSRSKLKSEAMHPIVVMSTAFGTAGILSRFVLPSSPASSTRSAPSSLS